MWKYKVSLRDLVVSVALFPDTSRTLPYVFSVMILNMDTVYWVPGLRGVIVYDFSDVVSVWGWDEEEDGFQVKL